MKKFKLGVLVLLAGILVGGLVNEMAAWAGLSQPITISFTSITGTSAQYNQTATTDDGTGAITFNGTGAPNIVNNTTGNLLVIHGGTSGFRIRNNAGTGTRLDLTDAGVLTVGAGTIGSGTAGTTSGGYLLSGSTSGTISILPQAAAGTYNFNLPTTAGAVGAILTSGGGAAAAMPWLADVATGQVLTSGGVGVIPAFSASPTVSSLLANVASASALSSIAASANGFNIGGTALSTSPTIAATGADTNVSALFTAKGNGVYGFGGGNMIQTVGGTAPTVATCGTGAVTAGSTNNAGRFTMTGATACTLTFNTATAPAAAPTCVISDATTLGGARISTAPTTTTFIVTATSGDVIDYVCLSH